MDNVGVSTSQTEELIKALQDLENAASGDATVRQKIASLPQEVQDVSLLEKITGEKIELGYQEKQTSLLSFPEAANNMMMGLGLQCRLHVLGLCYLGICKRNSVDKQKSSWNSWFSW